MSELGVEVRQTLGAIERHGNMATICRPEGCYSIVYGHHFLEPKKIEVPAGIDGICFERASDSPVGSQEMKEDMLNQKTMLNCAETRGLPLIETDFGVSRRVLLELAEWPIEIVIADRLLNGASQQLQKRVSRRAVIQCIGATLAGIYFALPGCSYLGRTISTLTGTGEASTVAVSKLAQRTHPEYKMVILKLRDAVAAQKMLMLLRSGEYKYFLVPRGAEHVGLETEILSRETQRMDFLRRLKPILPWVLSDPASLYQITVYRFIKGDWMVTKKLEEPNLRQLIK